MLVLLLKVCFLSILYEGTWTSVSLDPPPTVDSVWVSICILHFYMKVPGHPWVWIRPPRWIRYGFLYVFYISIWRYLDIREFGSAPHGGFGMGFYMYSTFLYEGTWTYVSLDPPPTVDSEWVFICILHFYMKVPWHPWVWIRPHGGFGMGFYMYSTFLYEGTLTSGSLDPPPTVDSVWASTDTYSFYWIYRPSRTLWPSQGHLGTANCSEPEMCLSESYNLPESCSLL